MAIRPYHCLCLIVFTSLMLSACGGSGSSAGQSSNSSTELTCENFKAPSATISYAGASSEASVDTDSLQTYSKDLFTTMSTLDNLKAIVPVPLDTPPSTAGCSSSNLLGGSGSANVIQKEIPDGSGYGYVSYKNYSLTLNTGENFTLNGVAYATFASIEAGTPQIETVSFINLHVTVSGYMDVTLNGTMTIEAPANVALANNNSGTGGSVSANMVIADKQHGTTIWAHNLDYSDSQDTYNQSTVSTGNFMDRSVSGTLYDAEFGYINVSAVNPISYSFKTNISKPYAQYQDGGPLKFTGATASIGYFIPLSLTLDAIALDDAGNGTWDKSTRIDAGTFNLDTTPYPSLSGPVPMAAVSGAMTVSETDTTLQVEGLRSYSPAGKFITYHWSLLSRPGASNASLSNIDSAVPIFTPDVAGTYLLELTVSDGETSNSEDVALTATVGLNGTTFEQSHAVAGPDLQAHVGQTVTVDGRASIGINTGTWAFEWTLIPPPGSNAKLSYTGRFANTGDQTTTSFVPDIPGFYTLVLNQSGVNGYFQPEPGTTQVIAVDTGFDFHRPATVVDTSSYQFGFKYAVGDFNDDGIMDVATIGLVLPTSGSSYEQLNVFYGSKQGGLSSPKGIEFNISSPDTMIAADVNNDGRTDLLVDTYNGVFAILQQADGTMAPPVQIGVSSSCVTGTSPVQLVGTGSWKSASTTSIYTDLDSCLDIYNNTSAASFASVGTETNPIASASIYPFNIRIADVTGDGITDILGLQCTNLSDTVVVFPGQADGSFGSAVSYALPSLAPFYCSSNQFTVGDFNHDGLLDVAALNANGGAINLFLQNGSSVFAAASNLSILAAPTGDSDAVTADLTGVDINGDGRDDLLLHNFDYTFQDPANPNIYVGPTYLGLLLQNDSGSFGAEWLYPLALNWSTSVAQSNPMAIGDFNDDGLPDLITFDGNGSLMVVYQKAFK